MAWTIKDRNGRCCGCGNRNADPCLCGVPCVNIECRTRGGLAVMCGYGEFPPHVSVPPKKYRRRRYLRDYELKTWKEGVGAGCVSEGVFGPTTLAFSCVEAAQNTEFYPFGHFNVSASFSIAYACDENNRIVATITLTSASGTLIPDPSTGESPSAVGVQMSLGGLLLSAGQSGQVMHTALTCLPLGGRVFYGQFYNISNAACLEGKELCFGGLVPEVFTEVKDVSQEFTGCVEGAAAGSRTWATRGCVAVGDVEPWTEIKDTMPVVSGTVRGTYEVDPCTADGPDRSYTRSLIETLTLSNEETEQTAIARLLAGAAWGAWGAANTLCSAIWADRGNGFIFDYREAQWRATVQGPDGPPGGPPVQREVRVQFWRRATTLGELFQLSTVSVVVEVAPGATLQVTGDIPNARGYETFALSCVVDEVSS